MLHIKLLILTLIASLLPAQITPYDGPFGPAYGYLANGTLVAVVASGQGQAPNLGTVTRNSTFTVLTNDYGADFVAVVMGLTPDAAPLPYSQFALVGTTLGTFGMSQTGPYYDWSLAVGNDPALVGLHLYFQVGHLFLSNSYNDFITSNGIAVTIQ